MARLDGQRRAGRRPAGAQHGCTGSAQPAVGGVSGQQELGRPGILARDDGDHSPGDCPPGDRGEVLLAAGAVTPRTPLVGARRVVRHLAVGAGRVDLPGRELRRVTDQAGRRVNPRSADLDPGQALVEIGRIALAAPGRRRLVGEGADQHINPAGDRPIGRCADVVPVGIPEQYINRGLVAGQLQHQAVIAALRDPEIERLAQIEAIGRMVLGVARPIGSRQEQAALDAGRGVGHTCDLPGEADAHLGVLQQRQVQGGDDVAGVNLEGVAEFHPCGARICFVVRRRRDIGRGRGLHQVMRQKTVNLHRFDAQLLAGRTAFHQDEVAAVGVAAAGGADRASCAQAVRRRHVDRESVGESVRRERVRAGGLGAIVAHVLRPLDIAEIALKRRRVAGDDNFPHRFGRDGCPLAGRVRQGVSVLGAGVVGVALHRRLRRSIVAEGLAGG